MLNHLLNHPLFADSSVCAALRETPLGFVDVGARGGVHPLVEPLAGVTAVLAFEPDQEECIRMQKALDTHSPWALCQIEPCALAEAQGNASIHLFSAATNNSLRAANEAFVERYKIKTLEPVGILPLQTTTLDEVLFSRRSQQNFWGEFLKLDAQGGDFEVLKGTERTLSERTLALFVEVEFFQLYKGQKLFSEVETFLRDYGFSFYGFASIHHRSCKSLDKRTEIGRERLMWADAVFFKDPLPGGNLSQPLSKRDNQVLFACAVLLGYYDFALELVPNWAEESEAKRLKQLIHSYATLPPAQNQQEVLALLERIQATPELTNIEVGHFVDQRKHWGDYDDAIWKLNSSSK
ncbi:FkbM family methyltransferase [Kovacikia minuta CCNUW1]|uniref:FkbM family methyltransferase n=1 Tax=Kovacikia minuta TaxID=2931930 RepID=UPI001CC9983B|nr:FkbM family methyltransferase [Kovacikia minuta]UBF25409.1 FkbM family methyltransferase [Kovacikia minuta CCNUW1]